MDEGGDAPPSPPRTTPSSQDNDDMDTTPFSLCAGDAAVATVTT
ncbi:hypothetical protein O9K63_10455 [Janibacter cremeus]|nr:hypothetical protein [Janibacter cremeus]WEV77014.1 hypothetical protein O9K63_10455 [Janibacter cremeus]